MLPKFQTFPWRWMITIERNVIFIQPLVRFLFSLIPETESLAASEPLTQVFIDAHHLYRRFIRPAQEEGFSCCNGTFTFWLIVEVSFLQSPFHLHCSFIRLSSWGNPSFWMFNTVKTRFLFYIWSSSSILVIATIFGARYSQLTFRYWCTIQSAHWPTSPYPMSTGVLGTLLYPLSYR